MLSISCGSRCGLLLVSIGRVGSGRRMAGTVGSAGVVMEAQGNVTLIRVGALPIGEKRSPSVLNTALMDRFDECLSQVERAGAKALVIRSCM